MQDYVFFASIAVLFVFGSLGRSKEAILLLGVVNAIVLIIYAFIKKGKILFPKYFDIYSLFIFILLIHTILRQGQWMFFGLFTSGGLFWLAFYNLSEVFHNKFSYLVIFLGGIMGLLFLDNTLLGTENSGFLDLYSPALAPMRHSHTGDLWAVILVILFYEMTKKRVWWQWITFIAGVYFLVVSMSRSAYLALIIGVFYIFYRLGFDKKYKKLLLGFVIIAVTIFIYIGAQKSTLFSRIYFLEAVVGILKHPLGVGMGYFLSVSESAPSPLYAHNLILEVGVGLGVFSAILIYWLFRVLFSLFKGENFGILYSAIFIAVFANFSFDVTYAIPTFFWIWFMSLGLAQACKRLN